MTVSHLWLFIFAFAAAFSRLLVVVVGACSSRCGSWRTWFRRNGAAEGSPYARTVGVWKVGRHCFFNSVTQLVSSEWRRFGQKEPELVGKRGFYSRLTGASGFMRATRTLFVHLHGLSDDDIFRPLKPSGGWLL